MVCHLAYTLSEALHRSVQAVFVCGEDTIPSLDLRGLARYASFCPYLAVCIRRPEALTRKPESPQAYDERLLLIDCPEPAGVSSTNVRQALRDRQPQVAEAVCEREVCEYLVEHNLL